MRHSFVKVIIISCCSLALFGCVSEHPRDDRRKASYGEKALAAAWRMIGKPYRFAGSGPDAFDCSGLVRYSYMNAGIDLPHQTAEIKQFTRPISLHDLRKGDLLFFEENGREYSHVGIYAGNNKFIHAASSRKKVLVDSLLDPYWQERFLDARRF